MLNYNILKVFLIQLLQNLYNLYLKNIIPIMGKKFANNKDGAALIVAPNLIKLRLFILSPNSMTIAIIMISAYLYDFNVC